MRQRRSKVLPRRIGPAAVTAFACALAASIPVGHAQDFDDEPPRACLGVNVITLEDVIFGNAGGTWEYEGLKNGLPVVNVVRGSPASLIGLRVGDFIVALNGRPVYLPGELVSRVRAQEIGGRFELEIYRRGDRLTARGVLGRLTGNLCQPARPSEVPPPPRQQESSR